MKGTIRLISWVLLFCSTVGLAACGGGEIGFEALVQAVDGAMVTAQVLHDDGRWLPEVIIFDGTNLADGLAELGDLPDLQPGDFISGCYLSDGVDGTSVRVVSLSAATSLNPQDLYHPDWDVPDPVVIGWDTTQEDWLGKYDESGLHHDNVIEGNTATLHDRKFIRLLEVLWHPVCHFEEGELVSVSFEADLAPYDAAGQDAVCQRVREDLTAAYGDARIGASEIVWQTEGSGTMTLTTTKANGTDQWEMTLNLTS